ncbi:Neurotrypsin [Holothuria leucospilota]|uniref:Neurotrypsin n=1 Tax=Holothuria leucospilota TaxID=206669 RepID=A0A9Q1BXD9_HOLLE|nr:Neurotrypsin [Holothuria leucospilota]
MRLVDEYSNSSGRVEVLIGEMWRSVCIDAENSVQDVRLAEGYSTSSGRIEVMIDGRWGGVCTDKWNLTDARVVCRQLGYQTTIAISVSYDEYGSVWVNDVHCRGNETSLSECKQAQIWQHECSSRYSAGVVCGVDAENSVQDVRLVDGYSNSSGRVEVLIGEMWRSVCSEGWDLQQADMVCRHLGYHTAFDVLVLPFFYDSYEIIWREKFQCNGNETSLSECKQAQIWQHECSSRYSAGVVCGELEIGVRYDGRCGYQYPLLNGQPSKFDPDSEGSCCSKHGWCGNGPEYCACNGCIDFRERWVRSDGRCGSQYPFTNGQPGECDPDSKRSCCSESGWCGQSPDNCTCFGCIDYRDLERGVRSDGRCGPEYRLTSGQPGRCDPESEGSCCSSYGWCGNSPDHCTCDGCIDYRDCFVFASTSLLRIYVTDRRGGREKTLGGGG